MTVFGLNRQALWVGSVTNAVVGGSTWLLLLIIRASSGEHLTGDDAASWAGPVLFFAFLLIAGGALLGGFGAGRLQPRSCLTHGTVAAVVGFVPILLVASLFQLVDGDWRALALVFQAFLVATFGMIGGWLGGRAPAYPEGTPGDAEAVWPPQSGETA